MLGLDLRYALRSLGRDPGFAAAATLTLALGIGASTAIFSVIENVLMEPFPYEASDRLYSVQIHDNEQKEPGGRPMFQGPEFLEFAEHNQSFEGVIANSGEDVLYTDGEGTERFEGYSSPPGRSSSSGCPPSAGEPWVPPTTSRGRHRCSCCATRSGSPGLAPTPGC